jgi:hypothetical protein
MTISIHQPNFFPYYPFFQKMEQSDIFVILQNCQFEKNNFQNRFNKDGNWYTMSVNKGLEDIVLKKYINPEKDWLKIKKMLPNYHSILSEFDDCISKNLAETNYKIILKIKDFLNLKNKIVLDYPTGLKATDRLIDICIKYNAKKYISGPSGNSYLERDKFKIQGIALEFQDEVKSVKKPIIEILQKI